MATDKILLSLVIAFGQLLIGLGLATASVYFGLKLFDRLTGKIDEIEELKRGNVAVGLLMVAVMFSIANVVQSGVLRISTAIQPRMSGEVMVIAFLIGIANLLIGVIAAVSVVFITVKVWEGTTIDINENKELARGNVAVAILIGGILLSVSYVMGAAIAGISNALDPVEIAKIIGL